MCLLKPSIFLKQNAHLLGNTPDEPETSFFSWKPRSNSSDDGKVSKIFVLLILGIFQEAEGAQ